MPQMVRALKGMEERNEGGEMGYTEVQEVLRFTEINQSLPVRVCYTGDPWALQIAKVRVFGNQLLQVTLEHIFHCI